MAEIALYRKYRPQSFADFVGQDHIKITLKEASKKQEISQAYLFSGPRGTGKTSAARIVAKAINCLNLTKEGEPCQICDPCMKTTEGSLIDVVEIDAASNRGIDEIRDLREKIKFAPSQTARKVYIIDEVHMLTKEAFNALLKTLEEPPSHAYFILATTEIHKVPETIISRCQCFTFHRIDSKTIVARLEHVSKKEGFKTEPAALELIAQTAEGGLRDALGLLEQLSVSGDILVETTRRYLGIGGEETLNDFFALLSEGRITILLEKINQMYEEGYEIRHFVKEFIQLLRQKLLDAVKNGNRGNVLDLLKMIASFQKAESEMKYALIPQLPLELAVIETGVSNKVTKNTVLSDEPVVQTPKEQVLKPKEEKLPPAVMKKEDVRSVPPRKKRLDGLIQPPIEEEHIKLTLENLKNEWKNIILKTKPPSVRRSFEQAKLISLQNRSLKVELMSAFHLEKLNQAAAKETITKLFEDMFGSPINIVFTLQQVKLQPDVDTSLEHFEDSSQSAIVPEKEHEDKANILAEQALDIFGGELVEE